MYGLDILTWALQVAPPVLRKATRLMAMIRAALATLAADGAALGPYATRMKKEAKYTGQRLVMEAALNEMLPIAGGLITVETVSGQIPQEYLYEAVELEAPLFIYEATEGLAGPFIYEAVEGLTNHDFEVNVPVASGLASTQVEVLVNRLKLAGKRYTIIFF